ncbi:hypothetical protein [Streptomyces sp. bgisy159]|uniref:hypothetical protein n=1 Tax=Streptomyces sp. bgisy159 TaxID=3413795 RepID=UPI003F4A69B8
MLRDQIFDLLLPDLASVTVTDLHIAGTTLTITAAPRSRDGAVPVVCRQLMRVTALTGAGRSMSPSEFVR